MDTVEKFLRAYHYRMSDLVQRQLEMYLRDGDDELLLGIRPQDINSSWYDTTDPIAIPPALDSIDERMLRVVMYSKEGNILAPWVDRALVNDEKIDVIGVLRAVAQPLNQSIESVLTEMLAYIQTFSHSDRLTSTGRLLISLDNTNLADVIKNAGSTTSLPQVFACLQAFAPQRIHDCADAFLQIDRDDALLAIVPFLLRHDRALFEPRIVERAQQAKDIDLRFGLLAKLAGFDPARYDGDVLSCMRKALSYRLERVGLADMMIWSVEHFGITVRDDLVAYMNLPYKDSAHYYQPYRKQIAVLQEAVTRLGADALPVIYTALRIPDADMQFESITRFIEVDDGSQRSDIVSAMNQGLHGKDNTLITRLLMLAAKERFTEIAATAWTLMKHKSAPVRQAAVRALAQIEEKPEPKALTLLREKKAEIRLAAVQLLAAVGTPTALQALEAHLDIEDNDDVREAILGALQEEWQAQGKRITRQEIEARIARQGGAVALPAAWLDHLTLPELLDAAGVPLGETLVTYLLARQARITEIRPSLELLPLYELIDRRTGGDFALALLQAFLGSGAEAKDRWVMTVVAMLGDNRLVSMLGKQIPAWVDAARGKLAEYAVHALALLGTDAALMLVDALTLRYRVKNKNIGAAAAEAFSAAASRAGVTVEELGDRVIPWLDFTPGQPRVLQVGSKTLQVRIGLDFKLQYRDPATGKKATLPGNAPAEVKAEMKVLTELLKEVAKGQVARLEVMMVRQYRWPTARWQELFLRHPVMIPFGVRLVWGCYQQGTLIGTFRALEDGSLTDVNDEPFTLPEDAVVGIVHPLELAAPTREAWQSSLADYEIEPPFLQIARPVVTVTAEQAVQKYYTALSGTSLNAMTFRGRAEKLGWRRGSVCDGGGITSYAKFFPAAGADAFLLLNGMYVGIDMYSDIELENAFFVRAGSVKIGSYEYDEPSNAEDPRLLAFAQVPPIVFSEVMADLQRIAAGKAEAVEA